MTPTFKSVSFQFEEGTVSWIPNKDVTKMPPNSVVPYKWVVYVGNTGKWFTWHNPNRTQAIRYLKLHTKKGGN